MLFHHSTAGNVRRSLSQFLKSNSEEAACSLEIMGRLNPHQGPCVDAHSVSNGVQMRSAKNAFWLKCLKDLKETCVCPLGSGFGSLTDLVQLTGLWSLILKSETSVVMTALGLFV